MDDGFGVGLGAERVAAGLEIAAQLAMVVDLAVEDDPHRAVFVGHRLIAAGAIDDGQAPVAERQPRRVEVAAAVGAAMVEPVGHRPDGRGHVFGQVAVEGHKAANAAHAELYSK